jgi:hypothetical protein
MLQRLHHELDPVSRRSQASSCAAASQSLRRAFLLPLLVRD